MQSETGFPSRPSHQLKSYVASKSRLKLAARAVLSADAGLLVYFIKTLEKWHTHKIKQQIKTRARDVLLNINLTEAPEITTGSDGMTPSAADARCLQRADTMHTLPGVTGMLSAFFLPRDLDLDFCPLTFTFKLIRARDRTRLPCEFGANPFPRYLIHKQKTLKTEPYLRAVMTFSFVMRS